MESLEVFDEFEEFELKCSHYTILVAVSTELLHILDKIKIFFNEQKLFSQPKNDYSIEPLSSTVDSVGISRCVFRLVCLFLYLVWNHVGMDIHLSRFQTTLLFALVVLGLMNIAVIKDSMMF